MRRVSILGGLPSSGLPGLSYAGHGGGMSDTLPGLGMPTFSPRMGRRSRAVAVVKPEKFASKTRDDFLEQYELLDTEYVTELEDELYHEDSLRGAARRLLSGTLFNSIVAVLITVNAVIIGLETDNPDAEYTDMLENALVGLFSIELMARFFAFGRDFFAWDNEDFTWNCFDTFIVLFGVVDFVAGALSNPTDSGDVHAGWTWLRTLRIWRILRVFRLVRFAKRLYVLAYGFLLAAIAVGWVTFLMGIALYICSIVLVNMMSNIPEDDPHREFFVERFGSVGGAMFTLFQLSVQPDLTKYRALLSDRPLFTAFLVFFIIFGSFGMIALLTGVISEAMFEKNILKVEEARMEREQMLKYVARSVADVFDSMDQNDEGEASIEELHNVLPRVAKTFETFGLGYTRHDLVCMLKLMDTDASGAVNRSEFIRGVLQMAEEVRPRLVMELHYDSVSYTKSRMDKVDALIEKIFTRQDDIAQLLNHQIQRQARGATGEELTTQLITENDGFWKPESEQSEAKESEKGRERDEKPAKPQQQQQQPQGKELDHKQPPQPDPTRSEVMLRALNVEVSRVEGVMLKCSVRLEDLLSEARTQALASRAAGDSAALQQRCLDQLAGIAARVGECDFSAKQACSGVALLDWKLQLLMDGGGKATGGLGGNHLQDGCTEAGGAASLTSASTPPDYASFGHDPDACQDAPVRSSGVRPKQPAAVRSPEDGASGQQSPPVRIGSRFGIGPAMEAQRRVSFPDPSMVFGNEGRAAGGG